MNLNLSAPLNSVSLGAVTYNILKELYNRGISPNYFPIGGVDLASFSKAPQDFQFYLQSCANKALKNYKKEYPCFKVWHINGSEQSFSEKQTVLTFLETDRATEHEVNILNNQASTLVTSSFTKKVMEDYGVKNVAHCPLGFDSENYSKLNNPHPYQKAAVVHGIFGKIELRKRSAKTLALWAKLYGNNPKHRLNVHVYNPFLAQDPNQCAQANLQQIQQALEGKQYWNINIINSYLKTSTELNNLYNSTDICIDLSPNENWSLPSFNCAAIGKHLVAVQSNGVADWANDKNAVLVKPSGTIPASDGRFFHPGQPFSQGNFFDYNEDEAAEAIKKAVERYQANPVNEEGLKLQEDFSWKKTVDIILETINKN